ncbi:hypothetical protein [Amycolatopsis sp. w19]
MGFTVVLLRQGLDAATAAALAVGVLVGALRAARATIMSPPRAEGVVNPS